MSASSAETIGLQAVAWLAGNETLLPVFMGATGVGAVDMRNRVQDPEFLASVLDFILMDDAWIVAFCDDGGLGCEQVLRARRDLPGGHDINWT